jgi:hypothetical protein
MTNTQERWWAESSDLRWEETPSGSKLRRVTCAPAISTVIYHEQPFTTPDGKRIAIFRTHDARRSAPGELLVYDIERYLLSSLLPGSGGQDYVATAAWSGVLFAGAAEDADGARRQWRVDLNSLECEPLSADLPQSYSISADLQYGLSHSYLGEREADGRRERGIFRVHLQSGERELLHRSYDIANPHLQYRLYNASRILVQENRGWFYDEGGNVRPGERSTVGLCSIAGTGGDRREFPVGGEYTPRTTGHECWIGDSDRVLVSLAEPHDDGNRRGTLLEVSHEWDAPRVVFDSPLVWNHVSASRCGRYFVADNYDSLEAPILVGSIATGRTAVLCHSKTSGGGAQHTHAHPYFTADNKWVVFNSDRTGITQVYLASVPEGLLESLD